MPQPEIQRLAPRHFEILSLCLAGNGPKEIAQALDMTPQAISLITKSQIFQTELARRRERLDNKIDNELAATPVRAKRLLDESALAAAQVHVDCLNEMDPKVRQASANSILDRVFGQAASKQQPVVLISVGDIENLRITLREVGGTPRELSPEFADAQEAVLV